MKDLEYIIYSLKGKIKALELSITQINLFLWLLNDEKDEEIEQILFDEYDYLVTDESYQNDFQKIREDLVRKEKIIAEKKKELSLYEMLED